MQAICNLDTPPANIYHNCLFETSNHRLSLHQKKEEETEKDVFELWNKDAESLNTLTKDDEIIRTDILFVKDIKMNKVSQNVFQQSV